MFLDNYWKIKRMEMMEDYSDSDKKDDTKKIKLYDATLREGAQAEGISISLTDKLKITELLDELGVCYIEGGWPGSNPKDIEYFQQVKNINLKNASIAAFGSTCRVNNSPEEDSNIQSLLEAETPVVTIFGKSWTLHVKDALRTSLDENLRMIHESVNYLKSKDREVIYDAEHFFDGYNTDSNYAMDTLQAAVDGGSDTLVLCDTNGGCMPWEIRTIIAEVISKFSDLPLGIHAHNDTQLAMANTITAIRTGVKHIQGTMNGYGERCGNVDLSALIPNLQLKMNMNVLPSSKLIHLTKTANTIAAIANQPPPNHSPYVGKSAFAHKGGIHASAMRRNSSTYQHVDPSLIGNLQRVLISELSGRSNLQSKAEELGIPNSNNDDLQNVLQSIKSLENKGYSFEGADASVELLLRRSLQDYNAPFKMIDFMVVVEHRDKRGIFAEATIKIRVGEKILHAVAEGNGPVNALYMALRKTLLPVYPNLDKFRLVDYKVHIINSNLGTGATTRVLIDMQDEKQTWSTVGASSNIIEASWVALLDAMEYGLISTNKNEE